MGYKILFVLLGGETHHLNTFKLESTFDCRNTLCFMGSIMAYICTLKKTDSPWRFQFKRVISPCITAPTEIGEPSWPRLVMETMKTAQAAIADANENVDRRIDQIEMRVKGVSLVCKFIVVICAAIAYFILKSSDDEGVWVREGDDAGANATCLYMFHLRFRSFQKKKWLM